MSEKNNHWGSTLNDFLREEGIYKEAKAEAVVRVLSWQLELQAGVNSGEGVPAEKVFARLEAKYRKQANDIER